jgi:hypothetical protein
MEAIKPNNRLRFEADSELVKIFAGKDIMKPIIETA